MIMHESHYYRRFCRTFRDMEVYVELEAFVAINRNTCGLYVVFKSTKFPDYEFMETIYDVYNMNELHGKAPKTPMKRIRDIFLIKLNEVLKKAHEKLEESYNTV